MPIDHEAWYSLPMRPGSTLAHRYEILQPLGHGAASSAFLALDKTRNLTVALKLLRRQHPDLIASLRREFVLLAGRFHPHLLRVHDLFHSPDHPPFYTADLIDGATLSSWALRHHWHELHRPVADVLDALRFLHQLGIRHGDVKPDNIIVGPNHRGFLIDLGCARAIGAPNTLPCGTPAFMAPELLNQESADGRADLFALGSTIRAVADTLPEHVEQVVARLLDPDPDHRPNDAVQAAHAFGFETSWPGAPAGRVPDLLGRARELRLFHDALDALRTGREHPRALFLLGRDGIGRTRLLNEMKWHAQQQLDVIEGWAPRADAFSEMIARALQDPIRSDVVSLLQARTQLLDRTRSRPVVLVLDDVHSLPDSQRELLMAWLRVLEQRDSFLMLLAGNNSPPVAAATLTLELKPLGEGDVAAWASGMGPSAARHIHRLSAGIPADVESIVAELASGRCAESDLAAATTDILRSSGRRTEALDQDTRAALARLALEPHDPYSHRAIEALGPDTIVRLQRDGWLLLESGNWRFARSADAVAVLDGLTPDERRALHDDLARRAGHVSDRAFHLAMAGDIEQAESCLAQNESAIDLDPRRYRRAAKAIGPGAAAVHCARILRLCGDVAGALRCLSWVLRKRPPRATRLQCRLEAASVYLTAGRFHRAERQILRGREDRPNDAEHAALLDVGCRILIQRGAYQQVVDDATRALSLTADGNVRRRLLESLGVAAAYLDQWEVARDCLRKARDQSRYPRDRVRIHSYEAIAAYREGVLENAIQGYRLALDIAEQHGLADHLATAALNLGTAQQQHGDWGQALESYERGLRVARAIGKENTARTLLLNLANLYASLGAVDRAEDTIATLRRAAEGSEFGYVQANIVALEGELAWARGRAAEAESIFLQARRLFESQGAAREIREVDLQRTAVALAEGRVDDARARLELAGCREEDAVDLRARWAMRAAEVSVAQGETGPALEHANHALRQARESQQLALQAEAEGLLAQVYERQSAHQLADDHKRAARRHWETIAVALPPSLRTTFFRHPLRASLLSPPEARREPRSERRDLVRILEINQRLNSSLSVDQILAHALDAAIELSSAERGFVLLKEEGPARRKLDVAVARNVDREKIGRSHLKFSRSIAERVIRTGAPVSTTDALADDRFRSHASVHAMQLRSVVCVPVTAPEGVLGAIYLDHRFRKEQFGADAIELLQAFANQVALALRNARLHADLARRTEALQAEQERVQALLQGQAAEIDRLSAEVETRQHALELRYDYGAIVGTSAPMRALFRTMDRITDANIDVLIQGESGTGKELVARALHYNSSRRDRHFVSINCAAIPDSLLESELFGVMRGAFTGADKDREGLLVAARGGTLFLDEVGEMSLPMQAKLLRVLQERRVRPLGGSREVDIDIRLVCATNRMLRQEVEAGRFRQDLYYRIGVVELSIPSLRERREDIPALCDYLLDRAAESMSREKAGLRSDALRLLMRHPWPGNVRQLDNVLRRALLMSDGERIGVDDLDFGPAPERRRATAADRSAFEKQEAQRILAALEQHRWNVSAVARALGVPRNTLYRKLRKYRIEQR